MTEPTSQAIETRAREWYVGSYFEQAGFAKDLVWTVKKTVFPNATDAELLLFLRKAETAGLDPTSQLIPVKFQSQSGPARLTFITTRQGLQAIAERTGNYGGSEDATFDDGLSLFEHLQKHKGKPPTTATAIVRKYVQGNWITVARTVAWAHYYPADAPPKARKIWDKMPHNQLAKCAEAAALRAAFPLVLDRLYLQEEMEQSSEARYAESVEVTDSLEDRLIAKAHEINPDYEVVEDYEDAARDIVDATIDAIEDEDEEDGEPPEKEEPKGSAAAALNILRQRQLEGDWMDRFLTHVFGGLTTFKDVSRSKTKVERLHTVCRWVSEIWPVDNWTTLAKFAVENNILLNKKVNIQEAAELYASAVETEEEES